MDLGEAEIVPSGDFEPDGEAVVVGKELAAHFKGQNVSISLQYYQKKPECWSDWVVKDLKGFTKVIELLRQQSGPQLRTRGRERQSAKATLVNRRCLASIAPPTSAKTSFL